MKACNVVRFRVKPGNEQRFIDAHRAMRRDFNGFLGGSLVRTGDRTFCIVGEWRSFKHLVAARPQMVATLDLFRPMLEDLGGGLGLTDPVSGEVVVRHPAARPKKAKAKAKAKKAKPRAKTTAKAKPKRAAPKAKPARKAAAAKRKR